MTDAVRRRRGLITITVMMATIMHALDGTIANVALPSIQGSLSATQEQVSWVVTSYIVASAIMTPFAGFSADPYEDYSQPWFNTRKVLRGGSWATTARIGRARYRNFFTPERNDVIAGFRTCAL